MNRPALHHDLVAVGDFSLNVANPITARHLIDHGLARVGEIAIQRPERQAGSGRGVFDGREHRLLTEHLQHDVDHRVARAYQCPDVPCDPVPFDYRRTSPAGSGAAAIAPEVLAFFMGLGLHVAELYGMTENVAVATVNFVGRIKLGTVGEPYPDIGFRLDEQTGEIQTKHAGVFAGYWNKPDKTAADALTAAGDHEAAAAELRAVEHEGKTNGRTSLVARAVGMLGSIDELAGRARDAQVRYEEAAGLAASAGDAPGYRRWLSASKTLRASL